MLCLLCTRLPDLYVVIEARWSPLRQQASLLTYLPKKYNSRARYCTLRRVLMSLSIFLLNDKAAEVVV